MRRLFAILLCLLLLLGAVACSKEPESGAVPSTGVQAEKIEYYILNTATKKYHREKCSYLPAEENARRVKKTDREAFDGYLPCKHCDPEIIV